MISLEHYMKEVGEGIIPDWPPHGTSVWGIGYPEMDAYMTTLKAREFCLERGLWTVIDQNWTAVLAEWIGDRKVLEIMAGGGWIAKALTDHGVEVIATDAFSWEKRHKHMKLVHEVLKLDAESAASQIPADVMLVSWPPYGETAVVDAVKAWGPDRPIVYIGEGDGGCNAPDAFWHGFMELTDAPLIPIMSWPGLHDLAMIGHWREPEGEPDDDT